MQSPQPPKSPRKNCFCGCLATPCRDHKYCSERCAREDTDRMLMGEPSHYRNVSQVCSNPPLLAIRLTVCLDGDAGKARPIELSVPGGRADRERSECGRRYRIRTAKRVKATSASPLPVAVAHAQGVHGHQEHPLFPPTGGYPPPTAAAEATALFPTRKADGTGGRIAQTLRRSFIALPVLFWLCCILCWRLDCMIYAIEFMP